MTLWIDSDQGRMGKLRLIAAALMIVSALTHISQMWVYDITESVIEAALFGVFYLIIGIMLLGRSRAGLRLGIVLPAIGGTLGILRFLTIQANPFSIFHCLIDVVVISICIYLLTRKDVR